MKNPFSTEFLLLCTFLLMVAGFIFFGWTQSTTQTLSRLAQQDAQEALNTASSTAATLKQLSVTPTLVPTATPSAKKVFIPVSTSKTVTPAK